MAVIPTQTDIELMQLRNKKIRAKVDVLNFNFQTVNSLEGRLTEGSINVDANSDIRRTCNITLVVESTENMIAPGGELWLDKFIKVYIGVENPKDNNNVVWNNEGLFLINNPSSVYNATTSTVTFEGLDLMAKLSGRRNGQLPAVATVVPEGSVIADVVRDTITELGGFQNYVIQNAGYTVPYDIKMDMGATIYELLVELRDLYSDWEMFFDVNGTFYFQQIPDGLDDAVILNFDELYQPLVVNVQNSVDFENVKNNIIVYGRLLDSGYQVQATAKDTQTDSPFNINKIGQINYIVNDENIYNDDLAGQRARYELFLHARLNDTITIEVVPIYWLNDVNIKIQITNKENQISGEYLIQSLTIPLGLGENMSINASKVYPKERTIGINSTNEYLYTGLAYSTLQTQFPYLP